MAPDGCIYELSFYYRLFCIVVDLNISMEQCRILSQSSKDSSTSYLKVETKCVESVGSRPDRTVLSEVGPEGIGSVVFHDHLVLCNKYLEVTT